ncbi:MAG: adenylate/guanylate cyclase domain-containing protein [Actinomycetota bacterium]|nr:adenylate/guanylate cyclase domain-containing protein [Actinomycetota bacterium]
MRGDLPSGTVTFLFTDVEGSTKLLHELGTEDYAEALAEHRRVIREVCARHNGVEVDTQGDAFFFAFSTAPGALSAAEEMTQALADGPIQVRMGMHTGTPLVTEEGYVGGDVHRAARIAAAGHGGQVLVSTSTATLVELELRDLGEHRFKDLAAPERVYQLADGDFPPLKSLYRTNLPVPATPFLGRERELAEVVELLTRDDLRLLTLTGPGGTGKTRLALQAAAEASESFPDGIYWVPLAPLRDPSLVLSSLAQTLAVKEEPDRPLEDTLGAHLAGKRLLLVLDNLEHLLPQAAAAIAALRDANESSLLVTSRERLRIGGEQTWPVPPLAEEDGRALFSARARAVEPSFTATPAVDELCARLDELPLAIELAAARTAVFSSEQLLERLSQRLDLLKGDRDADPRQQTLRATIEWSHDLLSEEEQRLFRRLAVFAGGCTYEAAEQVADADPDTLQSLLDKSLLRKRETAYAPRYWMLETIREYAGERLAEASEAEELYSTHARYFLAVAQELEPYMSPTKEWLDRLEPEHDNLRVALDRLEAIGETQLALRLAQAQWRFWTVRGHTSEGRQRLDKALGADLRPTAARADALNAAVGFAVETGDFETARRQAEEALALHRELGDAWGAARSVFMLGYAAIESGDFLQAKALFEESLPLFVDLGAEDQVMIATFNLAWACDELGDPDRGRSLTEENLRRARAAGNQRLEAFSLDSLAGYARDDGRLDDALSMHRAALRVRRDLGDVFHELDGVSRIAAAHSVAGDADLAARLLSSSLALLDEVGLSVRPYLATRNEKTLARIHAQLDEAAFAEAWEQGRSLTVDEAVALALGELD